MVTLRFCWSFVVLLLYLVFQGVTSRIYPNFTFTDLLLGLCLIALQILLGRARIVLGSFARLTRTVGSLLAYHCKEKFFVDAQAWDVALPLVISIAVVDADNWRCCLSLYRIECGQDSLDVIGGFVHRFANCRIRRGFTFGCRPQASKEDILLVKNDRWDLYWLVHWQLG